MFLPLMVSNPDIRNSIAARFKAMKFVFTINDITESRVGLVNFVLVLLDFLRALIGLML